MNSQQEQALVKRAQQGDREALGLLWDALTPKLFGYLINVLHDKTVAEDMLQSTWLRAIEALPRFQTRGSGMSAWLFAIARNECRQHWRAAKRQTDFTSLEHETTDSGSAGTENKLIIEQILHRLSEDDRELIRLRYIADLPLSDIARILNINFVAVRVRLHRALARARTAALSAPRS